MQMRDNENIKEVGFTVDAGLIQRLGYELVGKAETAVSELIKNSYDADATIVDVNFIDTSDVGGTLVISDNGLGMTEQQLINGFMRISSTDKLHNPTSLRFNRTKAGKKGIGRFAAQRLGERMVIITQNKDAENAIRIEINWNAYTIDRDLTSITFPIEIVEKEKVEGTTIEIHGLREKWTEAAIKRVFRYVLDLFQPDYLSERSKTDNLAVQNEETFKVNFYLVSGGGKQSFLNEQISIFDKSLATIEGYIDQNHCGIISIKSNSLRLDDILEISHTEEVPCFPSLSDVYFKIHYFIYDRPQYYGDRISGTDLKRIQELSKTASGVRLYRNGFRVLPYGEPKDDWTNIDKRWSSESGKTNIPLNNQNLFGFVEIIDPKGDTFEETASREGLIENEAFNQLSDFINKSLVAVRSRIAEKIKVFKERQNNDDITQDSDDKEQTTQEMFDKLKNILDDKSDHITDFSEEEQYKAQNKKEGLEIIKKLENLIEEAGMLRVLAGLGLTIGEFTHEMKQFHASVYSHISILKQLPLNDEARDQIDKIKFDFDNLFGYTDYFGTTISQNTNRKKTPIDILAVLDRFQNTIQNDLEKNKIEFIIDAFDFDVTTIPMHSSEWNSILYNLYTNSRKAIKRANVLGKILVEVGIDGDYSFIDFLDNGDGIPKENESRVFNAFFSTSTPASFDAPNEEQLIGTGLGLKIVKDIIISYKGNISIIPPKIGYSTCFRILIPLNPKK
ncbi:MAG: sensor histidine kinase [Bacteroidales bacterium]|nr:sensor histidine kinase [Bacteroidales bacterium]